MSTKYVYRDYIYQEDKLIRAPYDPELEFYAVIKSGDVEKTQKLCDGKFCDKGGLGILSENELQNLKYHFVITVAMLARSCIEGGMDVATSYNISDYYIQKVDKAKKKEEINQLHRDVCLEYARRMNSVRKQKITSRPIVMCIDYIADHLHTKISLQELADYVKLNPTYLSRLFKKEVGYSVSEYMQRMRIETAKNMLLYSGYSSVEIASMLAFSDQSYFTEVFRKYTGQTPKKYQADHLRETKISPNSER